MQQKAGEKTAYILAKSYELSTSTFKSHLKH